MPRIASFLLLAATALPLTVAADGPLFMKDLVPEGMDFPATFGVGLTGVFVDQDYTIDSLTFTAAALPPGTTVSGVQVDSFSESKTLKFDAWVLPFLNLHLVYGTLNGHTDVDFANNSLGIPLSTLRIQTDGTTFGYGGTVVFGNADWFGSISATWADTSLDDTSFSTGSVDTLSVFPKFGRNFSAGSVWIGGYYLDVDERHSGTITLPVVGAADFDVSLVQRNSFVYTAGFNLHLMHNSEAMLEFAFGDGRKYANLSFTMRF
jgi:hypothetical protein